MRRKGLDKQRDICYSISVSRTGEVCQIAISAASMPGESIIWEVSHVYAIIATGGKQYRVSQGDVIYVEKLDAAQDATVSFDVLLVEQDGNVKIGKPTVEGAKVEGKVVAHGRGEKITVFKYKSKKNYRRKQGHRQPFTKVEITSIVG